MSKISTLYSFHFFIFSHFSLHDSIPFNIKCHSLKRENPDKHTETGNELHIVQNKTKQEKNCRKNIMEEITTNCYLSCGNCVKYEKKTVVFRVNVSNLKYHKNKMHLYCTYNKQSITIQLFTK